MKTLLTLFILTTCFFATAQTKVDKLMTKANNYALNEKFERAEKFYSKVLKKSPGNIYALFNRGAMFIILEEHDKALQDFFTVIATDSTNFNAQIAVATILAQQKKYTQAIPYFDAAATLHPDDPKAFELRGLNWLYLKKYEDAKKDYNRAISLDSSRVKSYRGRSDCYYYTGKKDSCILDLKKILEITPGDSWALQNVAFSKIEESDYQGAASMYQKLYDQEPNDAYILSNFGYVKFKLGDTVKAKEFIDRSLKTNPTNSYAYKYLAEIHLAEGNSQKACEAIATALELGFTEEHGEEMLDLQEQHCMD